MVLLLLALHLWKFALEGRAGVKIIGRLSALLRKLQKIKVPS